MCTYHKVLLIFILIKNLIKRQSFEFLPTYDYNYIETGTDINRANLLQYADKSILKVDEKQNIKVVFFLFTSNRSGKI